MKRVSLALMAVLAMLPLVAAAHAHLQQAAPADGSVVGAAPESIMLMFSESAHLTALSIQKRGDARAQKIGALPTTASEHFAIAAPRLGPGVYTITYRVVAVDDGHTSAGAIKFTVSPGARGAGAAASAQIDAGPSGYNAVGTVKQVDVAAGKVTIAHEAIAALSWPAMTMSFTIKDKALFDKLAVDKRVQFNVEKQGALYVVTAVK